MNSLDLPSPHVRGPVLNIRECGGGEGGGAEYVHVGQVTCS